MPEYHEIQKSLQKTKIFKAVEKTNPEIYAYYLKFHSSTEDNFIQNLFTVLYILNLYCDYSNLLVNDKIPNMGDINTDKIKARKYDSGLIHKFTKIFQDKETLKNKRTVEDVVYEFFENLKSRSTGMFDFSAGYFSLKDCQVENCVDWTDLDI